MGKKRVAERNLGAIAVDHPDGGTFHIFPMTFEEAAEFSEGVMSREIERDTDGKILYNQLSGEPVKKYSFARQTEAQLDLAIAKLSRIDDVEWGDGTAFEQSPDSWRRVLQLVGTDDVEFDVELDKKGKEFTGAKGQVKSDKAGKVKRPVRENLYLWVIRKSAELAKEKNELERKN
jgi:hypothetical protein